MSLWLLLSLLLLLLLCVRVHCVHGLKHMYSARARAHTHTHTHTQTCGRYSSSTELRFYCERMPESVVMPDAPRIGSVVCVSVCVRVGGCRCWCVCARVFGARACYVVCALFLSAAPCCCSCPPFPPPRMSALPHPNPSDVGTPPPQTIGASGSKGSKTCRLSCPPSCSARVSCLLFLAKKGGG